jgi:hypothetical protein
VSLKVVYLAHPLGSVSREGTDANLKRAMRWYKYLTQFYPEVAVVADWIVTCLVLDDRTPEDRVRGIAMNAAVLALCDEVWLCGGRISQGMRDEADLATQTNIPVFSLVHLGDEPPVTRFEPRLYVPGEPLP